MKAEVSKVNIRKHINAMFDDSGLNVRNLMYKVQKMSGTLGQLIATLLWREQ